MLLQHSQHQRRLLLLALQEGEEGLGESQVAEIVRLELHLDNVHINGIGFREVEASLNPGIHEDAIEVGVGTRNARSQVSRCPLFIDQPGTLTWSQILGSFPAP